MFKRNESEGKVDDSYKKWEHLLFCHFCLIKFELSYNSPLNNNFKNYLAVRHLDSSDFSSLKIIGVMNILVYRA